MFGPILHVVRFKRGDELGALIEEINGTGYGLTFGVHSRIDAVFNRKRLQQHVQRGQYLCESLQ